MSRQTLRLGIMNQSMVLVAGSLVALVVLTLLLVYSPQKSPSTSNDNPEEALVMYCAAGIKPPIAAAAAKYAEEKFGTSVQLQYGGSGTLLSNLKIAKHGDLYLAADISYLNLAKEAGLVDELIPLAKIRPVMAVVKRNPKQVKSLDDLLRNDVKISLANPDAASVGKLTKKILLKSGHWERVKKKTTVFKPTVMDVAGDVSLKAVDVAIVWDTTVSQLSDKLDAIRIPQFDANEKTVTIGILTCSKQPTAALRFARYLQAPKKGQIEFKKLGYDSIDGDQWSVSPTLLLYSGGVNRLAIEETIRNFESREGVSVDVAYNGCGILVSQINAGSSPDAYFACDISYMQDVQEKFLSPITISETDMVIITKKGNPKRIQSIKDLAQKGLKIGIAHEKQSALGALTKKMMTKIKYNDGNLYSAVLKNVKQNTPTADLLVNQLRVGSLDASIVYRANVSLLETNLEVIPITEGKPSAEQPIAIGKSTKHPYLMQRLLNAISSVQSRERFESRGFRWRIEGATR